jgi:hypothetical protein
MCFEVLKGRTKHLQISFSTVPLAQSAFAKIDYTKNIKMIARIEKRKYIL